MKDRFDLIKFGKSECKRRNIKQTYSKYVYFINENNKKYFSLGEIFKIMKDKYHIYEEEKKEENICREISMIEYWNLGNISLKNYKDKEKKYFISDSDISRNWENDLYEKKFFGLSAIDYSFFQMLLKSKYISKGKEKSVFLKILKEIKNKGFSSRIIIDDEYINYINEIIKIKNPTKIFDLIKPKSSGNNDTKKLYIKDLLENFIESFLKKNISYLKTSLDEYFKNYDDLPNGLSEMIFGCNTKVNKNKYEKKDFSDNLNNSINHFNDSVINRIIYGSWKDYEYLIISHLNCLDNIFKITKDLNNQYLIEINNEYNILIDAILKKDDNFIINLSKNFIKPNEMLSLLNIENKNIVINEENIIKNYYSKEKLRNLLTEIKSCCIKENSSINKNKLKEIIYKHEHIKGKIDIPTFFEFISGMTFISKIYDNKVIDVNYVKDFFRTKLDTNFCPMRFAPGGVADICIDIIEEDGIFLNIEPTTQIINQTKMELDSSRNHLHNEYFKKTKKYNSNIFKGVSIIVAPFITESLFYDVKGWNERIFEKNQNINLFDIDSLIDMLESNKEFKEFILEHKINNDNLIPYKNI